MKNIHKIKNMWHIPNNIINAVPAIAMIARCLI